MSTAANAPLEESAADLYDVVVIGAGVSGMYALHHLRGMGLSVRVYDGAPRVGGTWWHNRYPGARVDGPSAPLYGYTFSDELVKEWDWSESQSSQPEVLSYLEHFADRFDLRRDIELETWVEGARYDEAAQRWTVELGGGRRVSCRFLICAVGALSAPNEPDIPGIEEFDGECIHTGAWPEEPVSFAGKRVGVIGTGSSGIQAIPEIAKMADHVTVFQRTAQYTVPARNRPLSAEELAAVRENWEQIRAGMTAPPPPDALLPMMPGNGRSFFDESPEERHALWEQLWANGTLGFVYGNYKELLVDEEVNREVGAFLRGKIREIVRDPATADKLMPDHFYGTKRPILDDGYYDTYNRENVSLVDLREDPIECMTATGVRTASGEHPVDLLVLATGFDAISGSMLRLDPKGRGGVSLRDKWASQFHNYLGLMVSDFPNLFMIHGPGTPGVLYLMPLGAELETEWIANCLTHMSERGIGEVEPTHEAELDWDREVNDLANRTLFPKTDSWYTGANIDGKSRHFAVHLGGPAYFHRIAEIADEGYGGFVFTPAMDERAKG
ncbi:MAG: NAD(P)/FAD-dependent oxidoreductase [bacterium]|nr:NAD(P)/FAD-dependent oxidoreductase [bacterium]